MGALSSRRGASAPTNRAGPWAHGTGRCRRARSGSRDPRVRLRCDARARGARWCVRQITAQVQLPRAVERHAHRSGPLGRRTQIPQVAGQLAVLHVRTGGRTTVGGHRRDRARPLYCHVVPWWIGRGRMSIFGSDACAEAHAVRAACAAMHMSAAKIAIELAQLRRCGRSRVPTKWTICSPCPRPPGCVAVRAATQG